MARPVMVREYWRIASAIPFAIRSQTARVASGVISLSEKPVPPVVKITLTCLWSARRHNCFSKAGLPSGRRRVSKTWYPCASSSSFIRGPLLSSLSPVLPLSLRVMTAAVKGRFFSKGRSLTSSPGRIWPPATTLAKTPSLGMMQSPITLKISQWLWHSLPI